MCDISLERELKIQQNEPKIKFIYHIMTSWSRDQKLEILKNISNIYMCDIPLERELKIQENETKINFMRHFVQIL